MKRLLYNKPQAVFKLPLYMRVRPYTMLSFPELYQLYEALKTLEDEGIEGDVVETGSWNGGAGAFMGRASGRHVWMFDSFEGFPEPTKEDVRLLDAGKGKGYIPATEEHAKEIVGKLSIDATIVKGFFSDTLHTQNIEKIALLHLDADLYESTIQSLEVLYDSVVPRGFIVINDFNAFGGCRQAVYEFFVQKSVFPKLQEYCFGGRVYFRRK